jgi:predicted PolB exonuclease-like 3'-5' exonuclease
VFPPGGAKQERWVRRFDDPAKDAEANDARDERFNDMQSRWHELKFICVKNGGHYEEEA